MDTRTGFGLLRGRYRINHHRQTKSSRRKAAEERGMTDESPVLETGRSSSHFIVDDSNCIGKVRFLTPTQL